MGTYADCPTNYTTQFGEPAEAWMMEDAPQDWSIHFCLAYGADVVVATGLAAEFPLRLFEQDSVLYVAYTVRQLGTPTTHTYKSSDAGQNWVVV